MRKYVLLGIAFSLLGLIVTISWVFSSMLLYPPPYRCRTRVVVYCKTPAQQGLKFEDVRFQAKDGVKLSGWWIPAPGSTRTIILSHGRGGTRVGPIRFAKVLHKAGFSVLAFDYRNAGKSQKSFNSMTFFERRDLKAAVDYAVNVKKSKQIGVYGISMGGATALVTMADDKRIKAALVEGAFSDVRDVIADTAWRRYKVGRFPLVDLAFWFYQRRGNFDVDQVIAHKVVARIAPRPLEFWHGTGDKVVYPYHSKRLFRAARAPKALWVVEGAKHVQIWNVARKDAERRMVRFFTKYLKLKTPIPRPKPPSPR